MKWVKLREPTKHTGATTRARIMAGEGLLQLLAQLTQLQKLELIDLHCTWPTDLSAYTAITASTCLQHLHIQDALCPGESIHPAAMLLVLSSPPHTCSCRHTQAHSSSSRPQCTCFSPHSYAKSQACFVCPISSSCCTPLSLPLPPQTYGRMCSKQTGSCRNCAALQLFVMLSTPPTAWQCPVQTSAAWLLAALPWSL